MQRHFALHIVAAVVGLQRGQQLHAGVGHEAEEFAPVEHSWAITATGQGVARGEGHGVILQLDVEGGAVGEIDALEQAHGLMVLVDLHAGDAVGGDVTRGQTVTALQHIEPLDVELVDGLSLILDQAVRADSDAGQFAEDVLHVAVGFGDEGGHVVGDRVVVPADGWRLNRDLLQSEGLGREGTVDGG